MTFGPLHCPNDCCGGEDGPFDFYGPLHDSPVPSSTGWVDFLWVDDSTREVGVIDFYTSVDEGWIVDYDITPNADAAGHKGNIHSTIAPWITSGEKCWVRRTGNVDPDGTEKISDTADLSIWTAGSDADITDDELSTETGTSYPTSNAYIQTSVTLTATESYRIRFVATAVDCSNLQMILSGAETATVSYDLDAHTASGSSAAFVTRVAQDKYEYSYTIPSATAGSLTIQIRMVSSGSTYDGSDGDAVEITWTSVFQEDSSYTDIVHCDVVNEAVIDHYIPDKTDDSDYIYKYPKTPLCETGAFPTGSNCETQYTAPDSSGYNEHEIILATNYPKRHLDSDYGSEYDFNDCDQWHIDSTHAGFLYCTSYDDAVYDHQGIDVYATLYDGDFSILIGGPADWEALTYPMRFDSDMEYLGDSAEYPAEDYYYEDLTVKNATEPIPHIVGLSPHDYGKAWAIAHTKYNYYSASSAAPWSVYPTYSESGWSNFKVVSETQTAKVYFGDIEVNSYTWRRNKPTAGLPVEGSSSEDILTVDATASSVHSSYSNTQDRVIEISHGGYFDTNKVAIDAATMYNDQEQVDCKILWADSDGTNQKAIVRWRKDQFTIEDQLGNAYENTSGDDTQPGWFRNHISPTDAFNRIPNEVKGTATSKILVTGETGTEVTNSNDDHYRGLCAIGNNRFVYFEDLLDTGKSWKMHVTGTDGWTLTSNTTAAAHYPDCVAASERHFYVIDFELDDDRMGTGVATHWCFGQDEDDPYWPTRNIVLDGSSDETLSTVRSLSGALGSSAKGVHKLDSIKNSSALELVPEQDRYPEPNP